MTRGLLGAALALLAATGCAAGPSYRRPALDLPEAFRGQPAPQETSFADLPWWDVFQDPQLVALLREALQASPSVATAAARVEQARATAGIAKDQLLPALGVQVWPSYQQVFSPVRIPGLPATRTPYASYLAQGTVSWELDLFGRLRRLREAALAEYLASEEAARGVTVSLVSDVARSYFQLMALDVQLEVARRSVASRQDTLALFRAQERGGVASGLQTASGEALLADAEATIPGIEQLITVVENRISILCGRAPGPVARGDLVGRPAPPDPPLGLPGTLLARRPDLRQAEAGLVAANAQIGAALARFYPSLTVSANGGYQSSTTSSLLTSGAAIFGIGAIVSWLVPVLKGYQAKHQTDAARAGWDALVATYRGALLNALGEVSTAFGALQRIRFQRDRLEAEVRARTEAVRLARIQFSAGVASYLDVVQAEQVLLPAELQLAEATGAQFAAYAELYRALGGGWQAPTGAGPPAQADAAPPPAP